MARRCGDARVGSAGGRLLLLVACVTLVQHGFAETLKEVDLPAFQAQIVSAQSLTEACGAAAKSCDPSGLPATERVVRPGGAGAFRAEWQWLRDAVGAAKEQPAAERVAAMQAAGRQLSELHTEAVGVIGDARGRADFAQARSAANAALATGEFQTDTGPTWIDRQMARVQDWFFRLLMGMDRIGSRNPWLAAAIEWTCFLLAAGGLVFFVRRSLGRQSLRIALGEGAAARRSDRDPTAWAQQAAERAAAGQWREAVHCLYWASIVSLEGRRAWKPNPTRTPREYLRLLRPGSEAQRGLRELTRLFERVWYGQTEATEPDFRAAESSFAVIQAADLKREDTGAPATVAAGAA